MLGHTRQDIYVVEAVSLEDHTVEKLLYPFRESTSGYYEGTYLGKWVAKCSRGDTDQVLIHRTRENRGFIKHRLEMDIQTRQRTLLTGDGSPVNINALRTDQIPQPRWRRR